MKPKPGKDNFTLFVLILGVLTAIGPLSIDMYLPAFPQIAKTLGSSLDRVELSLASFFIGISIGQLLYGTLSDRFGRKPPLYFGLFLYLCASLACAHTTSIEALILLRFLQAIGACAGMVISRAMVRDLFDHKQSAYVFSLLMLVMGLAPILAPLLGGYLIRFWGWHSIFYVTSLFSLLCLVLVGIFLPETRKENPEVKLSRTFHTYWEILHDRNFLGNALSGGLASAGMFAYITGSPFVFIEFFGIPEHHYGWIFGTNAFGLISLSQLNRKLVRLYGPEHILKKCFIALATLGVLLAVVSLSGGGFWLFWLPLFGFIATLGMTNPNAAASALAKQGKSAGAASALLGTIQFVIAAISSSCISAFHNGTTYPMALTIALCGMLSFMTFKLIFLKSDPDQNEGFA